MVLGKSNAIVNLQRRVLRHVCDSPQHASVTVSHGRTYRAMITTAGGRPMANFPTGYYRVYRFESKDQNP